MKQWKSAGSGRPGKNSAVQAAPSGDDQPPPDDALFGRVVSILDQARGNVVRAVNHNMVVAYWLIGREIVMELQRGRERAGYGDDLLNELSRRLTQRFGTGYSLTSLRYFRFFYQAYSDRVVQIQRTPCAELGGPPACPASPVALMPDLSPQLSWSHYRVLMRVENAAARDYYEKESVAGCWGIRTLERPIHTQSYERLVANQMKGGEGRRPFPLFPTDEGMRTATGCPVERLFPARCDARP